MTPTRILILTLVLLLVLILLAVMVVLPDLRLRQAARHLRAILDNPPQPHPSPGPFKAWAESSPPSRSGWPSSRRRPARPNAAARTLSPFWPTT